MKPNAILVNPKDTVAIAVEKIGKGETVRLGDGRQFPALTEIPYAHKVALGDIARGDEIIKYGEIIGEAKEDVPRGGWIHTHNLDIEGDGGGRR